MPNVVFVVPFAQHTTLRFVRAAASLPGVTLGIVSQAPAEKLPPDLREKIDGFARVPDALDAQQLTRAVRSIARQWSGRVDRLLGILEQLQEPLAETREQLGIRGMDVEEAHNFRDKSRMKDALRAADLPCARHGLAESAEQAVAFAKSCGFPLVAKPPSGAGRARWL